MNVSNVTMYSVPALRCVALDIGQWEAGGCELMDEDFVEATSRMRPTCEARKSS